MANEEELLKGPTFYPPVYQQRYEAVKKLINKFDVKTVLDLGCCEGRLLTTIKIHCQKVEVIIGIDIDKEILLENRFRTKPLMSEYLNKRETPLKMALYQGSVATADMRFADFDCVTCIEVIEHLHNEDLLAFPSAVFGALSPKIIAITTPNADFNVLFPNMVGFRHPDHKFEWTREQFKTWCMTCCKLYGYTADFSFIGFGPKGTEHLGACTQMAVFTKIPNRNVNEELLDKVTYGTFKLIAETIFPFSPARSLEEKLEGEIRYLINIYTPEDFGSDDQSESAMKEIPLSYITESWRIKSICKDAKLIRDTVLKLYAMSDNESKVILPREDFELGEEYSDNDDEDQYSKFEENEEEKVNKNLVEGKVQNTSEYEEFWD